MQVIYTKSEIYLYMVNIVAMVIKSLILLTHGVTDFETISISRYCTLYINFS
jgi:hypothetical protein